MNIFNNFNELKNKLICKYGSIIFRLKCKAYRRNLYLRIAMKLPSFICKNLPIIRPMRKRFNYLVNYKANGQFIDRHFRKN